jgi:hypothetical protein
MGKLLHTGELSPSRSRSPICAAGRFWFRWQIQVDRRRSGGSARAAWGPETADPGEWKPANPSSCQCAITMLVVHDYLGGELLSADVFRGGERVDGLPSQSALFELLKAVDGACGCTKIDCGRRRTVILQPDRISAPHGLSPSPVRADCLLSVGLRPDKTQPAVLT